MNAPIIAELPMVLECRVKIYDEENERLVGEILNVSADESILTDGKIDPAKLRSLVLDPVNHTYLVAERAVRQGFRPHGSAGRNKITFQSQRCWLPWAVDC